MNVEQKVCLWVGIGIFVLMGLFPPQMRSVEGGGYIDSGYGLIDDITRGCRIDASHLCIQWVMVAVVTGGLIFTFGDKKEKKQEDEQKE